MNKDNVEGKMKDMVGRVKRQVGEWTGDEKAQGEGLMDQAKGKIQNAWGDVKDAGRKAGEDIERGDESKRRDENAA